MIVDVISIFNEENILDFQLKPIVIDRRGQKETGKGVGVMRDILTNFFNELSTGHFIGSIEKVPVPRHNMSNDNWKSVARVIVYGLKRLNFFPLFISKCFLIYTILGEIAAKDDILLEGFLNDVSYNERETLKCMLKDCQLQ